MNFFANQMFNTCIRQVMDILSDHNTTSRDI
jgi:hypothetical protein